MDGSPRQRIVGPLRTGCFGVTLVLVLLSLGCYAPLRSPAIPACSLPDSFRTPYRSSGAPLNLTNLTVAPPLDYELGPDDVLEVTIPDLYREAAIRPMRVHVMSSGEVLLPLAGAVQVGGMNLLQAQEAITRKYSDGILVNPMVNVSLASKSTVEVLVLGEVSKPGAYPLPKFQNDVGNALAAAGGITEDADETIEVHRRLSRGPAEESAEEIGAPSITGGMIRVDDAEAGAEAGAASDRLPAPPSALEQLEGYPHDPKQILRIPLRGLPPGTLSPEDVTLRAGDVVVVPSRRNDVFWVVGKLSQTNLVRFTLGNRERELGAGLVIPRNRDIDVVTAVAMAGYIDPIDSPTTVTVHRTMPNGQPMLIHVDLIAARYDRRETIFVEPGDIIYLNPDAAWWFRRTFDRVLPDLITIPYREVMLKAFGRAGDGN